MDDNLHTNYFIFLHSFRGYRCRTNALAMLHVSLLLNDNLAQTSILLAVFHLKKSSKCGRVIRAICVMEMIKNAA